MAFLKRFSFLFLPIFFFIISLATLYDYGMNWDSPIHFARGQAFLRYILTGKTNYDGLPKFCTNQGNLNASVDFETGEVCDRHRKIRVSEYESNLLDFNSWAAQAVYGHPAFSGLMLAASNNIFFKFLGLVEDVPAYHLYSIFATFILALTISIWTKQTFGIFASIIAVLTLYTFPLLAGEQHLNVKDPPMAAFFTLSIYLFWLSITKKKPLYMIFSALAGGASFGTKFNFVFAPFILLPWVLTYGFMMFRKKKILNLLTRKMLISILLYPVIVFLVFYLSWPALWTDPIHNISEVVRYYQEIGGSKCTYLYLTPPWFTNCTQLFTLKYFFLTVPPFSILLFTVGTFASFLYFREKKYVTILWLTFFYLTFLRVTLSISEIYGGLRQIMEFVAPMAMISGVGAFFLRDQVLRIVRMKALTNLISILLIMGFIPILLILVKLHPNENVYFNFLLGGFRGAAQKNFPGYGNTYGNAYMQGIKWLNQNATDGAKLALVSGLGQNISRGSLRGDIDYANNYRSGYNQDGEYQILLIEGGDPLIETFRYKYLSFLEPLYDLQVDGISLLKIWKNEIKYLKKDVNFESQIETNTIVKIINKGEINIELDGEKVLKALGVKLPSQECKFSFIGTRVAISNDNIHYIQKAEGINNFTDSEISDYNTDYAYLFPADSARYIKITPPESYTCKLSDIDFSVFTFKNL